MKARSLITLSLTAFGALSLTLFPIQAVHSDTVQKEQVALNQSIKFYCNKHYLRLPVKGNAPVRHVTVSVDDKVVRAFDMNLAESEPDWWAVLDIRPFKDKTAVLTVDSLPEGSNALQLVDLGDDLKGSPLYQEEYRPQFHFTARRGWLNDPNGLVFANGEYHMFFQHNPYGTGWGNMHWGHAVSKDLVHWKELDDALYPVEHARGACFSGSAVVDVENSSGFMEGKKPPIVAAFTDTGAGESIVYSSDNGMTWKEYSANPVIKHPGRDPKAIWYKPGKHWVMALYDETDGKNQIAFYTSPDLKNWIRQSAIEGFYECPEIFELPLDGDKNNTRWVLYDASCGYLVGKFDGKAFTPETPKLRLAQGNPVNFYASQTYNNIPEKDGRRIMIAWMQNAEFPGMPFNQQMTFPVTLSLRTTGKGPRLFAEPIAEIKLLHKREHLFKDLAVNERDNPLLGVIGQYFHIKAVIEPGSATEFGFTLRGVSVTYDTAKEQLNGVSLKPQNGRIELEMLVDSASIEVFANDGQIYMPVYHLMPPDNRSISFFTCGGSTVLKSLEVYELASAWK